MPKKPRKKRESPTSIRYTAAEKSLLVENANKAGQSLSAYVKKLTLGVDSPRQIRRPSKEKIPFGKLLAHEAENVAILRAVLELDNLPGDLVKAINKALSRSPEIRKELLEAMGKKS